MPQKTPKQTGKWYAPENTKWPYYKALTDLLHIPEGTKRSMT